MGFADSVRITAAKQKQQLNDKVISIATELFTEAVNFSPVRPSARYAKGQFINNWRVGINMFDTSMTATNNMSGNDSRNSIASLRGSTVFLSKDGFVTLSNNLPYAGNVEYQGWPQPKWSGKVGPYRPVANAFIKVVPKYKKP